MEQRTAAIIVAGGSGRRCGGGLPKQFRLLDGQPVLVRTINLLAEALPGAELVVVLPELHAAYWKNLSARFDVPEHRIAIGGQTRFHSVCNGLNAMRTDPELIAVHDAVRPLATPDLIRRAARAAAEHGAAVPAVEPVDSFRETDGAASHVVDRSRLRMVQTPQAFRADLLRNAYEAAYDARFTDDASVVERTGHGICLVQGERTNLKLTTEMDFTVAEALLAARKEAEEAPNDDEHL